MKKADKKRTSEPTNIQNSLELVLSSFTIAGILLRLIKYKVSDRTVNTAKKENIKIFIALPASVKACTEVSPSMPVLVKKVEYNTKTKLSIANK